MPLCLFYDQSIDGNGLHNNAWLATLICLGVSCGGDVYGALHKGAFNYLLLEDDDCRPEEDKAALTMGIELLPTEEDQDSGGASNQRNRFAIVSHPLLHFPFSHGSAGQIKLDMDYSGLLLLLYCILYYICGLKKWPQYNAVLFLICQNRLLWLILSWCRCAVWVWNAESGSPQDAKRILKCVAIPLDPLKWPVSQSIRCLRWSSTKLTKLSNSSLGMKCDLSRQMDRFSPVPVQCLTRIWWSWPQQEEFVS